MDYWKWIASWQTINECLARHLFGHYREETNEGVRLDVEEGDTLYLHHTTSSEPRTGKLLGPFIAESDAQKNIVNDAWKHKGGYYWQVRIGWEDEVYLLDVAEELDDESPAVDLTAYAQSLSDVQGIFLGGKMEDGEVIISPR